MIFSIVSLPSAAAIFKLTEEQQERINAQATLTQISFMYLPLHVFRDETNINELLKKDASIKSEYQNDVNEVHKILPQLPWPSFLSELAFLNETNKGKSSCESISKIPIKNSKHSVEIEPNASTSSKMNLRKRKGSEEKLNSPQEKVMKKLPKSETSVQSKPIDDVSKAMSTSTTASNAGNDEANVKNTSKKTYVPTPFQIEINAMSFEEFVQKTNIEDIVRGDFDRCIQGRRAFSSQDRQYGLKEYDRLRKYTDKWHRNSLPKLKMKCQCKWGRTFIESSMQTDATDVKEETTQYSMFDINENIFLNKSTSTETPKTRDKEIQCELIHNEEDQLKNECQNILTVQTVSINSEEIQPNLQEPELNVSNNVEENISKVTGK